MDTLAIIPARAGSKRIPKKNVRMLAGKPLFLYSVEQAVNSASIQETYVTTNDDEIKKICFDRNINVIDRPEALSDDDATTLSVLTHSIDTLSAWRGDFANIVLLQPTTPFRTVKKINEAVDLLNNTDCDSVVSHIRVDYFHPNRMKKIVDNKIVPYFEDEIENVSRDKLPAAYYRDGSIYAFKKNSFLKYNSIFGAKTCPIINSREFFVNIDEERDWVVAEHLVEDYLKTNT